MSKKHDGITKIFCEVSSEMCEVVVYANNGSDNSVLKDIDKTVGKDFAKPCLVKMFRHTLYSTNDDIMGSSVWAAKATVPTSEVPKNYTQVPALNRTC